MNHVWNRREFLAASAVAGVGLLAADRLRAAPFQHKLHKAIIGNPGEATLQELKEAGFDGMESDRGNATPEEAAAARKIAEKLGLRIHSLLKGWMNFNSPDQSKVAADIASVTRALHAAAAYGAEDILLVPCRVGGMPMPEPWEFDIEFDEKTSHVKRVVKGDNAKYAKYIEAQNDATDSSRAAVRKLIPVAEKCQIIIGLENVWNNLWVKPDLARNFVASFDSPWVRAYFDIGNHVKYAPPEQWVRTLGKLIIRCHVKDFKLKPDGHGGNFCKIREGSVNWPAVRQALDDVGYDRWMTIELQGTILSLPEQSKRLDLILAGK